MSIRPAATSACSGQQTADGLPDWPRGRKGRGSQLRRKKKRLGWAGLSCQTARNRRAQMSGVERRVSYAALSRWRQARRDKEWQDNVQGYGIVAFEAVTDLAWAVRTKCKILRRSLNEGAFVLSFFQLPRCAWGAGRHLYVLIADKLAPSGTAGRASAAFTGLDGDGTQRKRKRESRTLGSC
jgi:hypothetical protein